MDNKKSTKQEEVILSEQDEAATWHTGISGWVSRHGHFYGNNERLARYDGSTHFKCSKCGELIPKHSYCRTCQENGVRERFEKMPRKEWNGTDLLYSNSDDVYFSYNDGLQDYIDEHETTAEALQLVICEPVYAHEIDPNEYYCDDLPEDGEVYGELKAAFDALNKVIRESKAILCWQPGKFAAEV